MANQWVGGGIMPTGNALSTGDVVKNLALALKADNLSDVYGFLSEHPGLHAGVYASLISGTVPLSLIEECAATVLMDGVHMDSFEVICALVLLSATLIPEGVPIDSLASAGHVVVSAPNPQLESPSVRRVQPKPAEPIPFTRPVGMLQRRVVKLNQVKVDALVRAVGTPDESEEETLRRVLNGYPGVKRFLRYANAALRVAGERGFNVPEYIALYAKYIGSPPPVKRKRRDRGSAMEVICAALSVAGESAVQTMQRLLRDHPTASDWLAVVNPVLQQAKLPALASTDFEDVRKRFTRLSQGQLRQDDGSSGHPPQCRRGGNWKERFIAIVDANGWASDSPDRLVQFAHHLLSRQCGGNFENLRALLSTLAEESGVNDFTPDEVDQVAQLARKNDQE